MKKITAAIEHYSKKPQLKRISFWLGSVAFGCVILSIAVSCLLFFYHGKDELPLLGSAGDYISGTAGTILSLATVLAVLATIIIQQIQLIDQKDSSEKDKQRFSEERFERTFFELVNLHNNIVEAMSFERGGKIRKGRECLNIIYTDMRQYFDGLGTPTEREEVASTYTDFFGNYSELLGHYLRNLYHIFSFIKDSSIIDRQRFANILRAQLSNAEQTFLFYNGLSDQGKNFYQLMVDFELLEQIEIDFILHIEHVTFYPKAAYGKKAVVDVEW